MNVCIILTHLSGMCAPASVDSGNAQTNLRPVGACTLIRENKIKVTEALWSTYNVVAPIIETLQYKMAFLKIIFLLKTQGRKIVCF